jgi:hypothetical protein
VSWIEEYKEACVKQFAGSVTNHEETREWRALRALGMLLDNASCDCGYSVDSDNGSFRSHSSACIWVIAERIRKGDF